MVQLETVEDFEKIKKVLNDPDINNEECTRTQPRDFCIRPFDYCLLCKEVTEFETPYGYKGASLIVVRCLGCNTFFNVVNPGTGRPFFYFSSNTIPPDQFKGEIKRLNSIWMQARFFEVELERRITKEKGELRKVQDRIQKLARLRGPS